MFRRWGRWGCQRAVQLCWRDSSLFLDLAEVVDDDADAEVEDEEGADEDVEDEVERRPFLVIPDRVAHRSDGVRGSIPSNSRAVYLDEVRLEGARGGGGSFFLPFYLPNLIQFIKNSAKS